MDIQKVGATLTFLQYKKNQSKRIRISQTVKAKYLEHFVLQVFMLGMLYDCTY